MASGGAARRLELTLNARVAIAPETLSEIVHIEAAAWAKQHAMSCEVSDVQSFRPGRPVPTHRMALGE